MDYFRLFLCILVLFTQLGALSLRPERGYHQAKNLAPKHLGLNKSEKIEFRCATEPASTTLLAVTNDEEVIIGIYHANGTTYMPIFRGLATPYDLPRLEEQSKVLTQMGTYGEIHWAKANCKIYGQGLYACYNGKPGKLGDLSFEYASFYTTIDETKYTEYVFRTLNMFIDIKVGEEFYTIPMEFGQYDVSSEECHF